MGTKLTRIIYNFRCRAITLKKKQKNWIEFYGKKIVAIDGTGHDVYYLFNEQHHGYSYKNQQVHMINTF
jgi:hypothetical protein